MKNDHSWIGVMALCIVGCPTAMPPPISDGGQDAGTTTDSATADSGPATENVEVLVVDHAGPLGSANVVIDDAFGVRHTGRTDVNGRASIADVAWGTGRVSITAQAATHTLRTLAAFTRADLGARADTSGTITLSLDPIPDLVYLEGRLQNVADATHYFDVLPDVAGGLTVAGVTFSGYVERRVPFNIYAFESTYDGTSDYHWTYTPVTVVRVARPPLLSSGTVTIDMAVGLPLTTVTGSFPIAADGNRVQIGVPNVIVTSDETDGQASYGFASVMDISTDGLRFDFSVAQLATIDAVTPITNYYLQTPEGLYGQIAVEGLPSGSAPFTAESWPTPPTVMTPAVGVMQGLHEPIELGDADPTAPVQVYVLDETGAVWFLDLPAGATTLVVPEVPDGFDTSLWTNLRVKVRACEPWPGHVTACVRSAGGEVFRVTN